MNDRVKRIIEDSEIRKRLYKAGIFPMMGPKGERGKGLEILGYYESEEELINHHSTGSAGECYLVNGVLYVWNKDKNKWEKTGSIQGPPGVSEKIKVGKTIPGETGTDANVIDNFDGKEHVLDFVLPKGEKGEVGLIGPTGPKGDIGPQGPKGDIGPRGFPGEIGISQAITIDGTETVEAGEDAEVQDDFENNVHHLTFYIPKGEKGDIGPMGLAGPTGPTGPAGAPSPTGYSSIAFASYLDTKKSGIAQIGRTRVIPGNNRYVSIPNGTDIVVKETGIFEIVLCGRISGVTENTGASFSLINKDTNDVISDLLFILEAGKTADMDFSEVTVVDIFADTTLQLKIDITGDASDINFSEMNILLKCYNI